jgi:hypothetical protein
MLTDAGVWAQAVLSTMNVGNCAVYYSWSRVQVGVEAARDTLQVLLALFFFFVLQKKSQKKKAARDTLQVLLFPLLALLLHKSCLLY